MSFFYETNNSVQGRESIDDDVGLNFTMERLEIENRDHQREMEMKSNKEEQSPLTLPPQP